jgi:hypothetical protein
MTEAFNRMVEQAQAIAKAEGGTLFIEPVAGAVVRRRTALALRERTCVARLPEVRGEWRRVSGMLRTSLPHVS